MSRWLLKTEPSEYSFAQLEKEGRTVWSGVTNNLALKHLRSMKKGDDAIVYHTGDEKSAVALARVASDPYPDPKAGDPKLVVVDLEPVRRLARPVALGEIRKNAAFCDFALVRISRLSVMPVEEKHWRELMRMAGA